MIQCQVFKLDEHAKLPEYATEGSAAFDIFALLLPGTVEYVYGVKVFNTGLCFEIPEGHVMRVYSRSGQAFKSDTRLANCVAIIDSDYRGELLLKLTKDFNSEYPLTVQAGQAIAQGIIEPIERVQFLEVQEQSETKRGVGGFGSTDKKFDFSDITDKAGNPI